MLVFNANTSDEVRISSATITALLRRADGGTDVLLLGGHRISVKPSIEAIRNASTLRQSHDEGTAHDTVVREVSAIEPIAE